MPEFKNSIKLPTRMRRKADETGRFPRVKSDQLFNEKRHSVDYYRVTNDGKVGVIEVKTAAGKNVDGNKGVVKEKRDSVDLYHVTNDGKLGVIEVKVAVEKSVDVKVPRRRIGPKGKMAIVSDSAVESISRDMEQRTRMAIRKIGRSTGF